MVLDQRGYWCWGGGRDAEETDGACADSLVGADATLVMGK